MRALSSRNTQSNIVLRNEIDKIRLLFRKDRESYLCFYRILGFYPRNIQLYEQALLHKSISVRSDKGRPLNNERLEFLGDAILDAIVGDIVYKRFEGKREGFLTNTRSKIVQRETLNKLAVEIGLISSSSILPAPLLTTATCMEMLLRRSSELFIWIRDMNAANSLWNNGSLTVISIWIKYPEKRLTSNPSLSNGAKRTKWRFPLN